LAHTSGSTGFRAPRPSLLPAMPSLGAGLLTLGLAACRGESGTWHFVDVSKVVCPGELGEVTIEFPLDAIGSAAKHEPHVLTIFRVSTGAVNLTYRFTDSAQPAHTVDERSVRLQALPNSSRRLRAAEKAEDAEAPPQARAARGGKRMLSGKGFYHSHSHNHRVRPRHRGEDALGSRRRAGLQGARRRAAPSQSNAFGSRRRGAPPEAGARRRTYGAGGSRWGNKQDPAAGSYGYTSQGALNQNFGGRPPVQTPYGYSGANAYQPSSAGRIALAVGGGLLAGTMASYLFSRWSHGAGFGQCTSLAGQHYASCEECRSAHPGSQCTSSFGLPVSAARDDLMSTGFVPADLTGPLRLRLSQIQGAAFRPEVICPPAGWSPGTLLANASLANASLANASSGNVSWAPSGQQALFVTLTRVEALGSTGADDRGDPSHLWAALVSVLASLLCVGFVTASCLWKRSRAAW